MQRYGRGVKPSLQLDERLRSCRFRLPAWQWWNAIGFWLLTSVVWVAIGVKVVAANGWQALPGVAAAGALLLLWTLVFVGPIVRAAVRAGPDGVEVCNGWRTYHFAWEDLVGVCFVRSVIRGQPLFGLEPGGGLVALGVLRRFTREERATLSRKERFQSSDLLLDLLLDLPEAVPTQAEKGPSRRSQPNPLSSRIAPLSRIRRPSGQRLLGGTFLLRADGSGVLTHVLSNGWFGGRAATERLRSQILILRSMDPRWLERSLAWGASSAGASGTTLQPDPLKGVGCTMVATRLQHGGDFGVAQRGVG